MNGPRLKGLRFTGRIHLAVTDPNYVWCILRFLWTEQLMKSVLFLRFTDERSDTCAVFSFSISAGKGRPSLFPSFLFYSQLPLTLLTTGRLMQGENAANKAASARQMTLTIWSNLLFSMDQVDVWRTGAVHIITVTLNISLHRQLNSTTTQIDRPADR